MNRIKSLRKYNKMSRNELATKIGVSDSTVAAYEQGIRNIDIEKLLLLSSVFDVSVDYLIGNDRLGKKHLIVKSLSIGEKIDMFVSDLKEDIRKEIKKDIQEEFKYFIEENKKDAE